MANESCDKFVEKNDKHDNHFIIFKYRCKYFQKLHTHNELKYFVSKVQKVIAMPYFNR